MKNEFTDPPQLELSEIAPEYLSLSEAASALGIEAKHLRVLLLQRRNEGKDGKRGPSRRAQLLPAPAGELNRDRLIFKKSEIMAIVDEFAAEKHSRG